AVADRFGPAGIAGWRLARGEDESYVAPRRPPEPLRDAIDFSEPAGDEATLHQAAAMLLERLLAAPRLEGRPVRTMVLGARVAAVAPWSRLPEGRELLVPWE